MYRVRNAINYNDRCAIIICVQFICLQTERSKASFIIDSQIKIFHIYILSSAHNQIGSLLH